MMEPEATGVGVLAAKGLLANVAFKAEGLGLGDRTSPATTTKLKFRRDHKSFGGNLSRGDLCGSRHTLS
jgi:hypothetical protein